MSGAGHLACDSMASRFEPPFSDSNTQSPRTVQKLSDSTSTRPPAENFTSGAYLSWGLAELLSFLNQLIVVSGASYSRKFGVYVGIYIDDWWKELVSSGPDFVKWLEAFGYRFKGVSSVILLL